MQPVAKKWISFGFLLSILLHVLIGVTFLVIATSETHKKPPQFYQPPIPAYTYTGAITSSTHSNKQNKFLPQQQMAAKTEPVSPATNGKYAISKHDATPVIKPLQHEKSILEMSQETLQQNQMMANIQRAKEEEPILLIGDTHEMADPLIKLLGRALSAHFNYPKMEGEFGVKGKVLVELVFHPEGFFSDISIVQSSNNANFDAAALYAVNTAPKVIGANHFLEKPKHFIVGFIFN